MEFYFDAEFDAIRRPDRCIQCLVSIGIVAAQEGKVIDTYYSLIQPLRFRKLTRVVREMTQLNNDDIRKARSFATVMKEVEAFFARYDVDGSCTLYAFGPDDTRTIHTHAAYEKTTAISAFDTVIDLQKQLSKEIVFHDNILSPTLSLDDLKYIYEVAGEVVHNALNDALDLMRIHQAARHHQANAAHIQEIAQRKEAKRLEVKRRSQERMIKILHDRYGSYDGEMIQIPCYPDIIEQLSFLAEHGGLGEIKVEAKGLRYHQQLYPFDKSSCYLHWQMKEQPQMECILRQGESSTSIVFPLTYRNAGIFDDMMRLAKESKS